MNEMMTTFLLHKYNHTNNDATVQEEIDDDGAKINEDEYDDDQKNAKKDHKTMMMTTFPLARPCLSRLCSSKIT